MCVSNLGHVWVYHKLKSALKMILGDICWFCDLSSMQLWFPAAVNLGKSSLNCGLESASAFFFFIEFGKKHSQTLYSM